jgi:hypothetical protein
MKRPDGCLNSYLFLEKRKVMMALFKNRTDAGQKLASKLAKYAGSGASAGYSEERD